MERTIILTGGTSGFGALTAEHLLRAPRTRLILSSRHTSGSRDHLPLDLSDLGSVRNFAHTLFARLGREPIDALELNAGIIRPHAEGRTVDGFETTFAVNHLASYLLLRLLLPAMREGGTVVLTTSGTHDPATGAGLSPPRHAVADLLAHPDQDPDLDPSPATAGQHAYTAAKLCTLLTAHALARMPECRVSRLTAIAYCPGQVFGTGLARSLSLSRRIAWRAMGTPLGGPLRRLDPRLNTRSAAAGALADLALGLVTPPPGRTYTALRAGHLTWPQPSELARSNETARALWTDSARLVGLPARLR